MRKSRVWEGEAPAEPKATAGRRPPEAYLQPPADSELKLALGSAGASPSQPVQRI